MKILGIETSCDETAAAVIKGGVKTGGLPSLQVLSNIIYSQINIHKQWGGVIPEVAAREHVIKILPVIDEALNKAKVSINFKNLDAIAVATGPGLITSLLIGVETAKTLSYAWNIPIIPINHVEAHIYANFIEKKENINFPAIALTVSGGHTKLILIKNHGDLTIIGETRDDAAGEAFDKGAKMMGLNYPGGPSISAKAKKTPNTQYLISNNIKLPRPMINSDNFDFSFSGLKTALRYALQKDLNWKNKISEYCYEYQQAIIDVLLHKTIKAAQKFNVKTIMLSGGVTANKELRKQFKEKINNISPKINYYIPKTKYTTDNAAMIASIAYFKILSKKFNSWQNINVKHS